MKYFLQNKIRIPKDIAVIGFDNISLSAMYEPALSTIALPIGQLGTEAIRLFMQRSGRPQAKPRQVILKSQLIVRTSTDASMPVEFGE
jgi:LacI family repressor for deo operon, udp, cdd, tsx, nupC, and nupG